MLPVASAAVPETIRVPYPVRDAKRILCPMGHGVSFFAFIPR